MKKISKNDQERMREEVALFRYGVISELVRVKPEETGQREKIIQELSSKRWVIPNTHKSYISPSTIRRWIKLYQKNNDYRALMPKRRKDRGQSRKIDDETILALVKLRKEHPNMAVPALLERMRKLKLITPGQNISTSSAYRILKREGLTNPLAKKTDRRRYEAEYPNEIWQSDVLHGPRVLDQESGKQRKSYLIAFLDDHSRLIPYGAFYFSENTQAFLDAFREALVRRGVPRKLYVDNGSAYRSLHLRRVCASLGISKYNAKPYQPQGKGKIERFFRTVRQQFLSGFAGDSLEELNLAFDSWLSEVYHQRKHSSTGQTPFNRFVAGLETIRKSPMDLEEHFRKEAKRRVTKDRVVSLNGRKYEAPVQLIGEYVSLLFHPHKLSKIEIIFQKKSYGYLVPLDKYINNSVKRINNQEKEKPEFGKLKF